VGKNFFLTRFEFKTTRIAPRNARKDTEYILGIPLSRYSVFFVGKIFLSPGLNPLPPELPHEIHEKTRNIFGGITLSRYSVFFVGKIFYCRVGNHLRNLGTN
jgi:hypothetical protein